MQISSSVIIFDLDGVLVNSDEAIVRQWRAWAEFHGVPFEEVEAIYHGRPMVEVIGEVAPHLDATVEAEQLGEKMSRDTDGVEALGGADELLRRLPRDRWTIGTSSMRHTAKRRLAAAGLPVPDQFVSADDVEHGKPDPEPYQLAAQQLGVDPSRCLVFEDAPAGVAAARAAGAAVIAVATTNPPDVLSDADAVVRELSDVRIDETGEGAMDVVVKENL